MLLQSARMAASQSMLTEEPTMGDFVRHLSASLSDRRIGIPFESERPWHEVFFDLASEASREERDPSTRFLTRIRFDADGEYPKCRRLSDYLQTLHWLGAVSVNNPSYRFATVPSDLLQIWLAEARSMPGPYQALLTRASELMKVELERDQPQETAPLV